MLNLDLVTTKEAADIIGVTDARVRQMRKEEKIKAVKIDNRTWMIPLSEAQRLAENPPKTGRPRKSEKNSSN